MTGLEEPWSVNAETLQGERPSTNDALPMWRESVGTQRLKGMSAAQKKNRSDLHFDVFSARIRVLPNPLQCKRTRVPCQTHLQAMTVVLGQRWKSEQADDVL